MCKVLMNSLPKKYNLCRICNVCLTTWLIYSMYESASNVRSPLSVLLVRHYCTCCCLFLGFILLVTNRLLILLYHIVFTGSFWRISTLDSQYFGRSIRSVYFKTRFLCWCLFRGTEPDNLHVSLLVSLPSSHPFYLFSGYSPFFLFTPIKYVSRGPSPLSKIRFTLSLDDSSKF